VIVLLFTQRRHRLSLAALEDISAAAEIDKKFPSIGYNSCGNLRTFLPNTSTLQPSPAPLPPTLTQER
jgi:hypothetical protein